MPAKSRKRPCRSSTKARLISMPLIERLRAQSAVRMSRPPPTPTTPTSPFRINRWGSEETSYFTQSSLPTSPSHCVITVPAPPSMYMYICRMVVSTLPRPAPQ